MDHGPMAMTMASASSTTPSTSTPNAVVCPASRTTSVTHPRRSCAPRSIAACSIASVNRAGCTCAVVAGVPSLPCTSALSPSQASPAPRHDRRQPAPFAGQHAPGVEPAIAPAAAVERGGQLGVQVEAAPGEPAERGAVAPIQRQEAARLARGGAGDAGALDHDHLDLPQAEEVGGAGADHPAAADHHAHGSHSVAPA